MSGASPVVLLIGGLLGLGWLCLMGGVAWVLWGPERARGAGALQRMRALSTAPQDAVTEALFRPVRPASEGRSLPFIGDVGLLLKQAELPMTPARFLTACGATALAMIRTLQPQAVFLDIAMPELTGLEVAASLAALPVAPRWPRVPPIWPRRWPTWATATAISCLVFASSAPGAVMRGWARRWRAPGSTRGDQRSGVVRVLLGLLGGFLLLRVEGGLFLGFLVALSDLVHGRAPVADRRKPSLSTIGR